jgi:hypothetical protein
MSDYRSKIVSSYNAARQAIAKQSGGRFRAEQEVIEIGQTIAGNSRIRNWVPSPARVHGTAYGFKLAGWSGPSIAAPAGRWAGVPRRFIWSHLSKARGRVADCSADRHAKPSAVLQIAGERHILTARMR